MIAAYEIDVVIPCIEKDLDTLELCIDGIRKYGKGVRRIIVVSEKRLTEHAEWFDENSYPMKKEDIARVLHGNDNPKQARVGWVFQQFLKLYAPFVIPDISENVLLLDSDTIFLRDVEFIDEDGTALYNVGTEYYKPYFDQQARLFPGLPKINSMYSGICHHMLIQRAFVEEMMGEIEALHGMPFWEAVLTTMDKDLKAFSEYELYFNYIFWKKKPVRIRGLRWANICKINRINKYRRRKFDYVSAHVWMRK